MNIGLLIVDLFLPTCKSLKTKRSILKRQISSLRKKYNAGVSEIAKHDAWKHAQVGIVTVNTDKSYVEGMFRNILKELDYNNDIEVLQSRVEHL